MTLETVLKKIFSIIGLALSMALVASIYSIPKQEPELNNDREFIGQRVGEHCDN